MPVMPQISARLRTCFVALALALLTVACTGQGALPTWTALPALSEPPVASQGTASGSPAASAGGETAGPASQAPSDGGDGGDGGDTVALTIGTDPGTALEFDPATVTADAGTTLQITFENRAAGVPHNLTFDDPIGQATATTVEAGASETLEFPAPEPGDYRYLCTLHPGMEGTLTIEG
jgi:plastocyanin